MEETPKNVQADDRHQRGQRGVDGAAEALLDGAVDDIHARRGGRHLAGVLADAVEDDDGVVDGVATIVSIAAMKEEFICTKERRMTMKESMISTSCTRPSTAAAPELKSKRMAM